MDKTGLVAPATVSTMARELNPQLNQKDALDYAKSLPADKRPAKSGCYVIRCMKCGGCPVACSYNLSCGDCLWPGISTIPFGCFICLGMTQEGYYTNIKGDTVVSKVDEENETLACFAKNCGPPCCYCVRQ
mmetsp:Transcript_22413/g.45328  ORF Transcript_22413/g.45328 Transcript_22413/m.45328 type:complete len:131 (-) Transcript_22413:314-706(-)